LNSHFLFLLITIKLAKMRYFSKFISMVKYIASTGNLIRKLHLSEVVNIKTKNSKNYSPTKRGKKLISLAAKIEIKRIIAKKNPLFFKISRLYFHNREEGLSRYAKEFSNSEFERILVNRDYVKFIAFNNQNQPVGVLIMTDNTKLLMSDIWLDEKYIKNHVIDENNIKKYWISQSFVDKKERNRKIFSSLIVKVIQFCKEENALVFFDWAVENTPYIPVLIKSTGNEIGIKIKGRNISCEICSVFWLE